MKKFLSLCLIGLFITSISIPQLYAGGSKPSEGYCKPRGGTEGFIRFAYTPTNKFLSGARKCFGMPTVPEYKGYVLIAIKKAKEKHKVDDICYHCSNKLLLGTCNTAASIAGVVNRCSSKP